MPTFKITLAYDGADFCGWQSQPNQRTVQGELEQAWLEITGETVRLNAAGRTDAGVHAAGQVASVESATTIPPESLVHALNSKLPDDAAVQLVERVADGFHATHDAKFKRYRYTIYNDPRRPIFDRKYAWHIPTPLDVAAMQAGGGHMVGTHDFASFQSVGSERESTVRTIFAVELSPLASGFSDNASDPLPSAGRAREGGLERVPGVFPPPQPSPPGGGSRKEIEMGRLPTKMLPSWREPSAPLIHIDVEGDGFLYNMVRTIAGTLVEVGRGKRPPEWVAEVIAAKNRCAAGQTAPAHGLSMLWVAY